jgi:hypothetical protein
MIVEQGQAAQSNIEQRHAFTIKANAKAFKLLSSNLYSDKPLAIVRELGCNALDSHVAAGKVDVPFKVVLPSDLHPYFEVIDYGTGLSDEQVKNIFTTYFESTKTTSNDYIGAMGLGSKSPFSYTDAFEVFARQDGVENHYTCFLNKDGAPEIFLIETLKDDPAAGIKFENGVSIKVPIKAVDNHRFHQAARSAYRFFPTKPVVGANVKWDWAEDEIAFTGSNFYTLRGSRHTLVALMGPVAYPMDLNQLPSNEHTQFIARYMRETGRGFVIQYKIGELDVNAGREGLSYDKDTIANLAKGLVGIRAEMAKELQDNMDKCANRYDAIACWLELDRQNLFNLTWNGKKITESFIRYSFKETVGTEIVVNFEAKQQTYRKISLSRVRPDNVCINPAHKSYFVLIDDRKAYAKRIRYADKRIGEEAIFLLPTGEVNKGVFDEIIKDFDADGTPYKYLSDIPYTFPEKDKTPRVKYNYSGFYEYTHLSNATVLANLTNLSDEDFEEDSIYIKWHTTQRRVQLGTSSFKPYSVPTEVWKILTDEAKKQGRQLVVVTTKVFDKIPDNWIDATDVIKAAIKLAPTKKSFKEIAGNWLTTGLELKQNEYDQVFSNPKVSPVFKELFDIIRSKKFGAEVSYSMSDFIRDAFGLSEPESECDGVASINKMLFHNTLLENMRGRYYYQWPTNDFNDSLVLFSSLISYGIIDEQKMKECFKTV